MKKFILLRFSFTEFSIKKRQQKRYLSNIFNDVFLSSFQQYTSKENFLRLMNFFPLRDFFLIFANKKKKLNTFKKGKAKSLYFTIHTYIIITINIVLIIC